MLSWVGKRWDFEAEDGLAVSDVEITVDDSHRDDDEMCDLISVVRMDTGEDVTASLDAAQVASILEEGERLREIERASRRDYALVSAAEDRAEAFVLGFGEWSTFEPRIGGAR